MFESADGLLTAWTRQNDGRPGMVTVSDSFREPAGTSVDSATVASPNARPFKVVQAAPLIAEATGRSWVCAESPMPAARTAAPPKNDAYFRIMAVSVMVSQPVVVRCRIKRCVARSRGTLQLHALDGVDRQHAVLDRAGDAHLVAEKRLDLVFGRRVELDDLVV